MDKCIIILRCWMLYNLRHLENAFYIFSALYVLHDILLVYLSGFANPENYTSLLIKFKI